MLIYGGGASMSGSVKPTRLPAELKRKGAFEAAGAICFRITLSALSVDAPNMLLPEFINLK